jgi:hypothetical protein
MPVGSGLAGRRGPADGLDLFVATAASSDRRSDTDQRRKACMSKMVQLVQEMHARLNEIANGEQALVLALGHALNRVDQHMRNITAEHEARRGAILLELESFASRIGALPTLREPVAGPADNVPVANPVATTNSRPQHLVQAPWPPVASDMQDEIDLYFEDRRSSNGGMKFSDRALAPVRASR